MNWERQFTRPLMRRSAGHSAAMLQFLCDRAEDNPDLARHLLTTLHDMECTCGLDVSGKPEPVISQK